MIKKEDVQHIIKVKLRYLDDARDTYNSTELSEIDGYEKACEEIAEAVAELNENTCVCCGGSIPEGSQVCRSCQADAEYKAYEEGMRAEATKEMTEAAGKTLERIGQAVRNTLGMVDKSVQRYAETYRELEEKHLSECRQISEYEQENKALRRLLRMALPYIVKSCSACDCKMLSDECKARSIPNTCFKWKHYDEAIRLLGGK